MLRLKVGAGGHEPIAPVRLTLQLPADGGHTLAFHVGDTRLVAHRVNDVTIELACVERDVWEDALPVALRHLRRQHAGRAVDEPKGEHAYGGRKHHQNRAELVAPQVAPDFAPDNAHHPFPFTTGIVSRQLLAVLPVATFIDGRQ